MDLQSALNKLPVASGKYLAVPSIHNPDFLFPITSRSVFNNAVRLIKPASLIGKLKQQALLLAPFSVIKKKFGAVNINSGHTNDSFSYVILPWNQKPTEKFTIFKIGESQTTIVKYAFNETAAMVENEHRVLSQLTSPFVPGIIDFQKSESHSFLETEFCQGEHDSKISDGVKGFFDQVYKNSMNKSFQNHPYVQKVFNEFKKNEQNPNFSHLIPNIRKGEQSFSESVIPTVLMHGDFSKTNLIHNPHQEKIIDWEEADETGAPIDVNYFNFRNAIDHKHSWKVHDPISFLTVLHFFYFQIKRGKIQNLKNFYWDDHFQLHQK